MEKLANSEDLKSSVERLEGSSPSPGTKLNSMAKLIQIVEGLARELEVYHTIARKIDPKRHPCTRGFGCRICTKLERATQLIENYKNEFKSNEKNRK